LTTKTEGVVFTCMSRG